MNKLIRCFALVIGFAFSHTLMAEQAQWQSPETVVGAETVSLEQAKKLHADGITFIDVRSAKHYKKRHIPGAVNLYVKDQFTESNLLKLGKKDTPMVVYCNGTHCSLSYKAAEAAVSWGFTSIKYFRAGMRGWRRDGNPVEYGSR